MLHSLLEAKASEVLPPPSTSPSPGPAPSTESPRRDLYKHVTGSSSLDNAIATARRSIETYDRILAQLQIGTTPEPRTVP